MSEPAPTGEFHTISRGDTTIIEMPPRLSVLEAVPFKQNCQELLNSEPATKRLVLDFHRTTFVDSSGVGALVNILKLVQQQGRELVLREVHRPVMMVFSVTGLDRVLVFESQPESRSSENLSLNHEDFPVPHPSVRSRVKRAMDIVGGLVGLSITAVLFPVIAIAIKLDSPGPIFFRQIRCGLLGKRFWLWKFRSMCADAEARKGEVKNQVQGPLFKNENDPRITRVGKFLRRTSLDELPQFYNVVKGDMSLVGTRPPTPDEVERYEVPSWQRLNVKPGMTGEWQVNGRSRVRNFEDVIQLDLRYQQQWSLLYDVKLILKTLKIFWSKNTGAY
ncbi:sugar transferase [Geitlerinema sp. PCC 9228]|jgi:anti-anti-sigma factor|uniref:sugar transferase n=1 Tax=Geitlerinema sp. PCC 9228 TaxID=111611 RepID=UPI0008F99847|nr:sugar transferase [Geitlerinema sp. PCC 9228]